MKQPDRSSAVRAAGIAKLAACQSLYREARAPSAAFMLRLRPCLWCLARVHLVFGAPLQEKNQHPTHAPFTRMLLPSVSPAPRTPPSSRPKTHHTSTLVAVIDDFLILKSVPLCVQGEMVRMCGGGGYECPHRWGA